MSNNSCWNPLPYNNSRNLKIMTDLYSSNAVGSFEFLVKCYGDPCMILSLQGISASWAMDLCGVSGGRIYFGTNIQSNGPSVSAPFTAGVWHHIVLQISNRLTEIWVDGVLGESKTIPWTSYSVPSYPMNLCKVSSTWKPQGVVTETTTKVLIDEFRGWGRFLDGNEIQKLAFRSILPNYPNYDTLKDYYKFDEGSGNSVNVYSLVNQLVSSVSLLSDDLPIISSYDEKKILVDDRYGIIISYMDDKWVTRAGSGLIMDCDSVDIYGSDNLRLACSGGIVQYVHGISTDDDLPSSGYYLIDMPAVAINRLISGTI